MYKTLYLILFLILVSTVAVFPSGDNSDSSDDYGNLDYRNLMREYVITISRTAKALNPSFIIIPQNGHELLCLSEDDPEAEPASEYINAIDGIGREDLFFGYNRDNSATPEDENEYMLSYMELAAETGISVLVTDYCRDKDKMDLSYLMNNEYGFISFAADSRELDTIPEYPPVIYNENNDNINNLNKAKNFLYLLNPEQYETKDEFISAVQQTDYDLVILDYYFTEEEIFLKVDIETLKTKNNGSACLIIAYMSIGEAEDYRYYWQESWGKKSTRPEWIVEENPDWEGNYKVQYWNPEWQAIIADGENSYLKKIINTGFDGVYLDIIDAFEYFED
jgi:cysteinyl-tRNA synthetase, unknown class